MRNIHAATLAELASTQMRVFLLIDKEIGPEHYRWTDCDVPILAGGELYEPRQFKLSDIRYSQNYHIDAARLSIDNIDELMTALYAGQVVQGSPTTVYLAAVDDLGAVIGEPIILFPGKVDDWKLTEAGLDESLKSRTGRGDVCTLLRHSPSCPWREFKGLECGYVGEDAWCDRTYARCAWLDNAGNFGGERWLASLATKEIWWGRTPAK